MKNELIIERLDPTCGIAVDSETAKYATRFDDEIYYFCSEECLARFEEDPEKYILEGDERRD